MIINTSWESTRRFVATKLTRLTQSIVVLRHLVAESWPFLVLTEKSQNCGYAFLFMFHMVLTSWKVAGSIPIGATGIFHWHNPSCRAMTLGLTQPLTEMSTRNISWGGNGGRYEGLTTLPPSCADCTGQQRFWPMRKNVSDVFLDAEFEYVSRISLSPTTFALHRTMWMHTPTYVSHRGPVGGSLDMMQQANCHVSYTCD